MTKDGFARGPKSHANADFAGAFADADEHDVHDTEATEKKCGDANAAHEDFHADDDHAIGLCVLHGVPDAGGFFIARIEVVQAAERAANLPDAILVCFQIPRRDEQAINGMLDSGRLVGKITAHGIEGDENFARVEAVVA